MKTIIYVEYLNAFIKIIVLVKKNKLKAGVLNRWNLILSMYLWQVDVDM